MSAARDGSGGGAKLQTFAYVRKGNTGDHLSDRWNIVARYARKESSAGVAGRGCAACGVCGDECGRAGVGVVVASSVVSRVTVCSVTPSTTRWFPISVTTISALFPSGWRARMRMGMLLVALRAWESRRTTTASTARTATAAARTSIAFSKVQSIVRYDTAKETLSELTKSLRNFRNKFHSMSCEGCHRSNESRLAECRS